ncbi:MAG: helix-turn-helix transcriptional regulator [Dehalococcoidia bacterium]|nr:helix-turn-helix transcriptional regulator [Dehalococcoidia bacterium]
MTQSGPPIDPISPVSPQAITERQREVARLVAAGRTNTEIAEELGITLDGAKYHVSELLGRLGLRRREEVAEWYRAHFGPVARVRSFLRGLVGLPTLGLLGGASAVGGVIAVTVIAFVALRGASAPDEIGPPDYVPFIQEWEITRVEEPTREAILEWNGCGDWEYREADASGQVHAGHGEGAPTDEKPSCDGPGFWFRSIEQYRGNTAPGYDVIGPFEYSYTYTRPCTDIANPLPADHPYGPDFCSEPGDTFEDRVVVEFDPHTSIPMRYSQYLDDVLASEYRATSLRLLDADEVRLLPTRESLVPPDATAQVTAVAIPQDAGTFETLLQWVPEGYGHALTLGDMEAWRDLAGVEAPDDAAGEEAYVVDLFGMRDRAGVGALSGPIVSGMYWYLGV